MNDPITIANYDHQTTRYWPLPANRAYRFQFTGANRYTTSHLAILGPDEEVPEHWEGAEFLGRTNLETGEPECEGHESTSGPGGISVYCDGSCQLHSLSR